MSWTLVTGASGGLGAALARALAAEGHSLLLHYHTDRSGAEATRAACAELGASVDLVQAEISDLQAFKPFASDVMALVNVVGPYLVRPALDTSLSEWRAVFDANFFSALALVQLFESSLKRRRGAIVNIGVAGLNGRRVDQISPAYRLAKESLWGLTRILARDLAPDGVRVNMVSPGQLEGSEDLSPDSPRGVTMPPMQRLGTACDIASAVQFLLSSEAEYITGQNLEVAGGYAL